MATRWTADLLEGRHRPALARVLGGARSAAGVAPIVSLARGRRRAMLVGQAPGQTEATGGRRSPAGREDAFRWLARAGLDEGTVRATIYIAAVTRCYPGPSPSGRGDRVPSPAEQQAVRRYGGRRVGDHSATADLPFGRLATDRFLPARAARAARRTGAWLIVSTWAEERVVIPLPQPAGREQLDPSGRSQRALQRAIRVVGAALSVPGSTIGSPTLERGLMQGSARWSRSLLPMGAGNPAYQLLVWG